MDDIAQQIVRARSAMVQSARFFGMLALNMEVVCKPSVETMATDGPHLFYAPDWVRQQSLEQLKGTICHEVLHVANLHHTRRHGREFQKWNKACDYAINPFVLEAGFVLPDGALLNPAWKGKSAEEIFRLLPDEPSEQQGEGGQPGGNENDPAKIPGGVMDAPGDDGSPAQGAELSNIEAETQVAVMQAQSLAKNAGQGTELIDRLAENVKQAQQDWREELRRFVQRAAQDDFSWTRPNKKFVSRGIYLPSLYSQRIGTIVLAVDMSGSVSDWFADFFANMRALHEDVRPKKLIVIYCASSIAKVEEFEADDDADFHPAGAGGTSFIPPFEYLEREGIEPDCFVYLTDLEGPAPKDAPSYPVVWACTTGHKEPWGEKIRLRR